MGPAKSAVAAQQPTAEGQLRQVETQAQQLTGYWQDHAVARLLKVVRDSQLFLAAGCEKFEVYMKQYGKYYGRFSSSRRANQLISALPMMDLLSELPCPPRCEAQASAAGHCTLKRKPCC